MSYKIVEMQLDRYSELIDFWKSCEGIYVSDDDEYENLEIYLKRNRKSNFIVLNENEIIATIKCSHDGRRGYIHHLAVKKEFRKQGIARELVNKCIEILRRKEYINTGFLCWIVMKIHSSSGDVLVLRSKSIITGLSR